MNRQASSIPVHLWPISKNLEILMNCFLHAKEFVMNFGFRLCVFDVSAVEIACKMIM